MPHIRRIYIIGFMGSGKTTTGKKLAEGLNWEFIDLDLEIEASAGKTISEIFSRSGEEYFRKLESELLHKLDIKEDTVVSLGGGTPCFSDNMDYINKTGISVYLKMTPAQLSKRLSIESGERPLLKNIPEKDRRLYITAKLAEREIHYNKASIIVNAGSLRIGNLISRLESIMQE
jgi:shikimate kinase